MAGWIRYEIQGVCVSVIGWASECVSAEGGEIWLNENFQHHAPPMPIYFYIHFISFLILPARTKRCLALATKGTFWTWLASSGLLATMLIAGEKKERVDWDKKHTLAPIHAYIYTHAYHKLCLQSHVYMYTCVYTCIHTYTCTYGTCGKTNFFLTLFQTTIIFTHSHPMQPSSHCLTLPPIIPPPLILRIVFGGTTLLSLYLIALSIKILVCFTSQVATTQMDYQRETARMSYSALLWPLQTASLALFCTRFPCRGR